MGLLFTLVLSLIDLILESGTGAAARLLPNARAGSLMVADLLTGSGAASLEPLRAFDFPLINFCKTG